MTMVILHTCMAMAQEKLIIQLIFLGKVVATYTGKAMKESIEVAHLSCEDSIQHWKKRGSISAALDLDLVGERERKQQ